jgi:outer membrane PBP1 activator LpoA protein
MPLQAPATLPSRRRTLTGLLATAGTVLAGCSGNSSLLNSLPTLSSGPATPSVPESTLGTGQVKVGLILPLSSGGNAGLAGQSMRNAAELALAEFSSPNIQILVKDDAGSADAARTEAQQALDEGAEIILGPLFAQSVSAVAQVARLRNVPVIAFSTDANVAASGVYLLSFLPESDVNRIVDYAYSTGKRSYAALIPDNPYGTVVDAAFRQVVTRRGARIVGLEHYPHDPAAQADAIKNIAQASPCRRSYSG